MKNPFDFFDKIYCINLDHRTDRWKLVQKQFAKVGILDRVERFSGIKHKLGFVGCRKSHLKIIRMAKEQNLNNVFIFEDDCKFLNYDLSTLNKAIQSLKKEDWELFYLGGRIKEPTRSVCDNLFESKLTSTQSYAVNKNCYDKILHSQTIEKLKEKLYIIDQWYATNMKSYCINPLMTTQRTSYSDIENYVVDWKTKLFIKDFKKHHIIQQEKVFK